MAKGRRGHGDSAVDDFKSKFDEEGRFRNRDGTLNVVFAMKGGGRFPGNSISATGCACERRWTEAEIGDTRTIHRSTAFASSWISATKDCMRPPSIKDASISSTKRRRLWPNKIFSLTSGSPGICSSTLNRLRRIELRLIQPQSRTHSYAAAIWLTPKSVAGFNAADFPELGLVLRAELQTAVQNFLAVATQVPADKLGTKEQYGDASVAFAKILEIMAPYLPVPDEAEQVEAALRSVEFPPWVVNWDYELGSDEEGGPAVWVNVFVEEGAPRSDFGRFALRISPKIRQALSAEGVNRWPYVGLAPLPNIRRPDHMPLHDDLLT